MKTSIEQKANDQSVSNASAVSNSNNTKHSFIAEAPRLTAQAKLNDNLFGNTIQRDELDEDEIQGKFVTQQKSDGNEALLSSNNTGMPTNVQAKMESAFNTDFSNVKVHANSSKATEVGAVAYTQGTDVHFAPGHYNPSSSSGQKLLGHELTHVVQQSEGRVKPTGEVAGMPLNDSPALEKEADEMGGRAAK